MCTFYRHGHTVLMCLATPSALPKSVGGRTDIGKSHKKISPWIFSALHRSTHRLKCSKAKLPKRPKFWF
jgi:hypothetical protein